MVFRKEDGIPAVIHTADYQLWVFNGEKHRTDGPAVIWENGDLEWYVNGLRHREDGPAIVREYNNLDHPGYQAWYIKSKRHRVDGPAIEWKSGKKEWWVNDQLHREDGPAVICQNKHYWYINGFNITDSVNKWFQMQGYEQHMEHLDNEIKIEFLLRFL